mmetsp:Transcript_4453/g.10437  ORF Transcript_4453/g.10437 Transcript_4453/m.10437 type:complete len:299 (+) Transcript_4453:351-1247(+)
MHVLRGLCKLTHAFLPDREGALARVRADAQRLCHMVHDDGRVGEGFCEIDDVIQLLVVHPSVIGEAVLLQQCEAASEVGIPCCAVCRMFGVENARVAGPGERVPDAAHDLHLRVGLQCFLHVGQQEICESHDSIADVRICLVDLFSHPSLTNGAKSLLNVGIFPATLKVDRLHDVVPALAAVAVADVQRQLWGHVRLCKDNRAFAGAHVGVDHRLLFPLQAIEKVVVNGAGLEGCIHYLDRREGNRPPLWLLAHIPEVVVRVDDGKLRVDGLLSVLVEPHIQRPLAIVGICQPFSPLA